MRLLLLPGMDGSGALWGPLLDALGELAIDAERVAYPTDVGRYDALLDGLPRMRGPTFVVAESFGGPLAIRLAARDSEVRALVLIASFSCAPRLARWMRSVAWLAPRRPPRFALRAAMLGGSGFPSVEHDLAEAIGSVEPAAMRTRMREIGRLDVRDTLAALRIPITWIHASRDRLLGASPPGGMVIDGPHLLAQTRPREVAALIRQRWESL